MSDNELENLWQELEDITMYEDKSGKLKLVSEWNGFPADTDQYTIWEWFNKNHSKGLQYLVTEFETVEK